MLTHAENELLTRVSPGTPMGNLMRCFWQPFALAPELPLPDCAPIRIRLLGEDLVAFRGSDGGLEGRPKSLNDIDSRPSRPVNRTEFGRCMDAHTGFSAELLGLLAANCPHRGASLFFGRNEENGLRCVYHGWKFDTTGACVDMPNEPVESDFRNKVQARAYPVQERGGVLWGYLGADTTPPPFPELEWTRVPESHRLVTKRIQVCNYLQNVEGEVDSSHVSFLHSKAAIADSTAATGGFDTNQAAYMARDRAPQFFVLPTEYGLAIGARRDAEAMSYYWRITQFLMPSYTMIPAPVGGPLSFTGAAPIDDEHMLGFTATWHPDRPLTQAEVDRIQSWTGVHTEVDPVTFQPLRNKDNDYLIDRDLQRNGRSFTGIRGIREEDLAVQESMGPIYDRRGEHLATADLAIIAMRRRLLESVRALHERGEQPYEARNADSYRVRSAALVLPRDVEWQGGAAEATLARI